MNQAANAKIVTKLLFRLLPVQILLSVVGAVNGIVKIKVAGDNVISATISMSAIKELGLEAGKEATAVIKATSVMVGID